jgi:4a-hydroxytetrahydrobiopterin dehydratase
MNAPLPLHQQRCSHQSGAALDAAAQQLLLSQLPGWQVQGDTLSKTYQLPDYHRTLALVNAVAWLAHEQDHHPDMQVSYNRLTVHWSTHSVGGLSLNDFICAARTEALWS